jgi:hypothetical protein
MQDWFGHTLVSHDHYRMEGVGARLERLALSRAELNIHAMLPKHEF